MRREKEQLDPPKQRWKWIVTEVACILSVSLMLFIGVRVWGSLRQKTESREGVIPSTVEESTIAVETTQPVTQPVTKSGRNIIKAEMPQDSEKIFENYAVKPGEPNWQKNTLLPCNNAEGIGFTKPTFGTGLDSEEIYSITFVSSLDDAPQTCWDVSAAQDGSVLAWTETNGAHTDLLIGAEGVIYAPENSDGLFAFYYNMEELTFGDAFSTQNARTMKSMFESNGVSELDLEQFDTSNVTDMTAMFFGCSNITKADISSFDTRNVNSMYWMFGWCYELMELDLSSFDTRNVKDMSLMFDQCTAIESINLDGFDTSNVTNMTAMFHGCSSLKTIDLSSFDTSRVTRFVNMFYDCTSLQALDLSGFQTDALEDEYDAGYMFTNCPPGIGDEFYAGIGLSRDDFIE